MTKAYIFSGKELIYSIEADSIFQDMITQYNIEIKKGGKTVAIVPPSLAVFLKEEDSKGSIDLNKE